MPKINASPLEVHTAPASRTERTRRGRRVARHLIPVAGRILALELPGLSL